MIKVRVSSHLFKKRPVRSLGFKGCSKEGGEGEGLAFARSFSLENTSCNTASHNGSEN